MEKKLSLSLIVFREEMDVKFLKYILRYRMYLVMVCVYFL